MASCTLSGAGRFQNGQGRRRANDSVQFEPGLLEEAGVSLVASLHSAQLDQHRKIHDVRHRWPAGFFRQPFDDEKTAVFAHGVATAVQYLDGVFFEPVMQDELENVNVTPCGTA